MLVPGSEIKRLVNGDAKTPPAQVEAILPDSKLGIRPSYRWRERYELCYPVPGLDHRLSEQEVTGYRTAFRSIWGAGSIREGLESSSARHHSHARVRAGRQLQKQAAWKSAPLSSSWIRAVSSSAITGISSR